MIRRLAGPLVVVLASPVFGLSHATGATTVPTTVRVSLSNQGRQVQRGSTEAVISRNGRFVAFTSNAHDLVAHDTNGHADVFLRDRVAKRTWLVSRTNTGGLPNGPSYPVAVTDDGRFVMFESDATNLNPGFRRVFVRDRLLGTTRPVDVTRTPGDGTVGVDLSENGRYATFLWAYSGSERLYRRNLLNGTTHLIASGGNTPGSDMLWGGEMTPDGSRTFYANHNVLYVHRQGRAHNWSVQSPISGQATAEAITPDARYLLFDEVQTDQITGELHSEVYRYDRRSGVATRISLGVPMFTSDPAGRSISDDGRFVSFLATDDGYSAGDTDGRRDLLIRDAGAGVTTRASLTAGGAEITDAVGYRLEDQGRDLTADGSMAVFWTRFPAVAGDTNGQNDVFLRVGADLTG